MLDIDRTLDEKFPKLQTTLKGRLAYKILKTLSHEQEINEFIAAHPHLKGAAFVDKVFEHFDFSFRLNSQSLQNIPAQGRVIIVANHPIGTLDGMALIKMVRSVRPDVKIVSNDVLQQMTPFEEVLLSVDNMNPRAQHKAQYQEMLKTLQEDQALIIFPAGEVSRLSKRGIADRDWKSGFIKLSKKTNAPILPIYIDAKNSIPFYALSALYRPMGALLLINEMFNKNHQEIELRIGKMIPWESLRTLKLSHHDMAQRVKRHTYLLKNPKKFAKSDETLVTIDTISHPACRKAIRKDLEKAEHLMTTPTGLDLYIVDYEPDSAIMHELGRVRELTFREVGEGTGCCWDLDIYDRHYRHLILWDDSRLEIAGAYRLGECQKIIDKLGRDALYANHMFELQKGIEPFLPNGLELGRCFVQPNYWNTRALDYLWYGMGNYLAKHPEIRYLFGSVSLSNSYSDRARELIVAFYNRQFGTDVPMAHAKCPFEVSDTIQKLAEKEFSDDYKTSYARLTERLAETDEKLPMLFKQYVELCDEKGCRFLDFNLAPDFNNAIGALMMVDIQTIKPSKHRYLKPPTERRRKARKEPTEQHKETSPEAGKEARPA
jgi:putative hemolysin